MSRLLTFSVLCSLSSLLAFVLLCAGITTRQWRVADSTQGGDRQRVWAGLRKLCYKADGSISVDICVQYKGKECAILGGGEGQALASDAVDHCHKLHHSYKIGVAACVFSGLVFVLTIITMFVRKKPILAATLVLTVLTMCIGAGAVGTSNEPFNGLQKVSDSGGDQFFKLERGVSFDCFVAGVILQVFAFVPIFFAAREGAYDLI